MVPKPIQPVSGAGGDDDGGILAQEGTDEAFPNHARASGDKYDVLMLAHGTSRLYGVNESSVCWAERGVCAEPVNTFPR